MNNNANNTNNQSNAAQNSNVFSNPLTFTDTPANNIYKSSTTFKNTNTNTQYFTDEPVFPSASKTVNNRTLSDPELHIQSKFLPITSCIYSSSASTLDINNKSFYVPSQVKQKNGLQSTPMIFNELNSISVADTSMNCMQVIHNILSANFDITDINYNLMNYFITGLVFMNNNPISFKICVWSEMNDYSRVEILRCKGNCLSFNDFFNAVKKRISQELNVISNSFECEEEFESECLSMSPIFDSLESLMSFDSDIAIDIEYSDMDLQQMADDIAQDSYQLETLVVILGCQSLKKKVLEFDALCVAVKNCLTSTDVAVQKTAEKILS